MMKLNLKIFLGTITLYQLWPLFQCPLLFEQFTSKLDSIARPIPPPSKLVLNLTEMLATCNTCDTWAHKTNYTPQLLIIFPNCPHSTLRYFSLFQKLLLLWPPWLKLHHYFSHHTEPSPTTIAIAKNSSERESVCEFVCLQWLDQLQYCLWYWAQGSHLLGGSTSAVRIWAAIFSDGFWQNVLFLTQQITQQPTFLTHSGLLTQQSTTNSSSHPNQQQLPANIAGKKKNASNKHISHPDFFFSFKTNYLSHSCYWAH